MQHSILSYLLLNKQFFFQYLLDCNSFTVYTDHKSLLSLLTAKHTLNKFRQRRLQFLSQFEMTVKHIARVHNDTANFLSRVLLKQDPEIHQANEALMYDVRFSNLLKQFTTNLIPVFTDDFKEKLFKAQKTAIANKKNILPIERRQTTILLA